MNKTNEELLPCPFCGGEAEIIEVGNEFTKSRKAIVECTECTCKVFVGAIRNSLEWCIEVVTKKWNTRTPEVTGGWVDLRRRCNKLISKHQRGE